VSSFVLPNSLPRGRVLQHGTNLGRAGWYSLGIPPTSAGSRRMIHWCVWPSDALLVRNSTNVRDGMRRPLRRDNSSQQSQKRTVKAKRTQESVTIGMDLGDRSSRYCMLSGDGKILREDQVPTTKAGMTEAFGALGRSRIAIEVGSHSPWVSRLLSSLGHEVVVANPRQVKLITESTRKDDRLDAQTLARLARIDPQLPRPI
jgi:Transposase